MDRVTPTVFAVGQDYQILLPVEEQSLFWVKVGERIYYDASNGVMNTRHKIHRVNVPMEALDRAGEYTVCIKPVLERKPYFTETGKIVEQTFLFHPVPETNIRAYHISDAHNLTAQPIRAARAFGKIDLLILNGDVIDHSGDPEKFANIYEICTALTGGTVPVVFSRGNHDMRGNFAEKFAEFTPNQNGNTFYSFRLGSLWGVVLDCGEDKADDHPEYGFTVACHDFRQQQTAFLQSLIANASGEYEAAGVKTRLVISHTPFTQKNDGPFDIEEEIYREWCSLLRENIKPDLMICGHTHEAELRHPGDEKDAYGQPCPVVIASGYDDRSYWTGCGLVLGENGTQAAFTDSEGRTLETVRLPY